MSPIRAKLGTQYKSNALSSIMGFIFAKGGFWGRKTGFCHKRSIFQLSLIPAKLGIRYKYAYFQTGKLINQNCCFFSCAAVALGTKTSLTSALCTSHIEVCNFWRAILGKNEQYALCMRLAAVQPKTAYHTRVSEPSVCDCGPKKAQMRT